MTRPQAKVAVGISYEWAIRRPWVFRYLEKEYVDAFFEEGTLQLSSFAAFSKHEDEQRLDASEGKGILVNTDTESEGQTMFAVLGQGHDAYVLCGSTIHSQELATAFGTDSGFRIDDPTAFGAAVAQAIPRFRAGREGSCIYANRKTVDRRAGRIDLEEMRVAPDRKEIDMGKMFGTIFGLAGDDLYFLKPAKYQHQAEYRILWAVTPPTNDFLGLECPDARQFCTRFEDL